jgi:hypothetical protein
MLDVNRIVNEKNERRHKCDLLGAVIGYREKDRKRNEDAGRYWNKEVSMQQ